VAEPAPSSSSSVLQLFWISIPTLAQSATVEVYRFNLYKPWPAPFDALAPSR
jgi:hypothetical protein